MVLAFISISQTIRLSWRGPDSYMIKNSFCSPSRRICSSCSSLISCSCKKSRLNLSCCSVTKLGSTLENPMKYSTLGFPVLLFLLELLKLMSNESVTPSNHLIPYRPLLLLPSIFPSIKIFSKESAPPIKWPEYCSISFSISPSNEYSRMLSCRIDWFDLLAVHENLRNLLQHHNLKESLIQCSVFFTVQLSHPYMTRRRTIVQLDGPLLKE